MNKPSSPLEEGLHARLRLLATTLRPATVLQYGQTVRLFTGYLRARFPQVRRADQLRRDPHMLGWLEELWTRRVRNSGKPWSAGTRAGHLIRMRNLLNLLADHKFAPPPG